MATTLAAQPAMARSSAQRAVPRAVGFVGSSKALAGRRAAPAQRVCCAPRRRVTTMGLFGLGIGELVVIAGVAAVVFGPSKLPEIGKSLGKTVKSFQSAAKARLYPGRAITILLCRRSTLSHDT